MGNTSQNRRVGAGTRRTDPEEAIAKIQAAAEEMTMHRYVHSLPVQTAREWEREALDPGGGGDGRDGVTRPASLCVWGRRIKFQETVAKRAQIRYNKLT